MTADRVAARRVTRWPRRTGEFRLTGRAGKRGVHGMVFACPCGCGDVSGIDFETAREGDHPAWEWDGNEDLPTLTPSLQKTSGCRWHGWLRAGVFIRA